jgi:hypothetical protein
MWSVVAPPCLIALVAKARPQTGQISAVSLPVRYLRFCMSLTCMLIYPPPPPLAVESLTDLGHLTYKRFLELFRQMVGLLRRVISPSQGLYLHRTQHRKMLTNNHAYSGFPTHDPSNQPAKTHASDLTATVTGMLIYYRC